jgi:hypothetical protein
MNGRKCGSCKHFERAPIARKGWCRNPLLYSPQQSHLVSEEDLDCERGMGNYWEPASESQTAHSYQEHGPDRPSTTNPMYSSAMPPDTSDPYQPLPPVVGASGYGEPPLPGGRDDRGDYGYIEEERYWTDYLRIAAPVLGVLIMVGLLWWWIASFLGDDDDNGQGAAATTTAGLPTVQITPTSSGTGTAGTGTPSIVLTPNTTPGTGATPTGVIIVDPTEEPVDPNGGGEIYAGALVAVANTGGTGVNVRAEANTTSEIVNVLLDGVEVNTTGDPVESEGFIWWPIEGDGYAGWVVDDYLVLVE